MDNQEIRYKILHTYSLWTALSGTRSGSPLKSREDIYNLLKLPDYPKILLGSIPITKEEFNLWHKENSNLLHKSRNEMPIGWTTKLINLYLKTMVYVGQMGRPELIKHIHPPIDNGLWDGIKEKYKNDTSIIEKTHSKSKIKDIQKYTDYTEIIAGIELIAEKENIFLIEVEHLWKGTEY